MKRTFVLLLALLPMAVMAQTGHVFGIIRDDRTCEPIDYVVAYIPGTLFCCRSEFNGSYAISGLEPGFHIIDFMCIDYYTKRVCVDIKPDKEVYVEVELRMRPFDYSINPDMKICFFSYPLEKAPGWRQTLHRRDPIMNMYGIGN